MGDKEQKPFPLMVKLCSDKAAFEARPKRNITIDMKLAKRRLETSGEHQIVIETPHIIIIQIGKAEITLSRDGRMLIKRVSTQNKATQIAREILRKIGGTLKS